MVVRRRVTCCNASKCTRDRLQWVVRSQLGILRAIQTLFEPFPTLPSAAPSVCSRQPTTRFGLVDAACQFPVECVKFFFVLFILQFDYCLSDGEGMFSAHMYNAHMKTATCWTRMHSAVRVFLALTWFIRKRFNRFMASESLGRCWLLRMEWMLLCRTSTVVSVE